MSQNQIARWDRSEASAANAERQIGLPVQWRKLLLAVHLTVAVSVFGTDLALITLSVTALTSTSPALIRGGYVAMNLLAGNILLPLAFAALFTGILLAAGSSWGLARYYWVLTKLVLTIAALTALVFVLRPRIEQAAAVALQSSLGDMATAGSGQTGAGLTAAIGGALLVLFLIVLISVYKPWGRIRLREH